MFYNLEKVELEVGKKGVLFSGPAWLVGIDDWNGKNSAAILLGQRNFLSEINAIRIV